MNFIRRTMFTAAVTLAASAAAVAADYPGKALDYIIPFGPGGESDITARLQQPFFKEKFGQDLVVSYKPGGGGAVGWAELNRLTGDGYTIMGVNLPHIAIVSDRLAADAETPLVIHNIGAGTRMENRLFDFPRTGHFRFPPTV